MQGWLEVLDGGAPGGLEGGGALLHKLTEARGGAAQDGIGGCLGGLGLLDLGARHRTRGGERRGGVLRGPAHGAGLALDELGGQGAGGVLDPGAPSR